MTNNEDTTGDEPFVEESPPERPTFVPRWQVRLPRLNRPAGAPTAGSHRGGTLADAT